MEYGKEIKGDLKNIKLKNCSSVMIHKVTEELNNFLDGIITKYWKPQEEEKEKRRKQLLWLLLGGVASVGAFIAWKIASKRNVRTSINPKRKESNYISSGKEFISKQIEKTKENIWMENLEPYLNETNSYYQYLVKSKQLNRDGIRFDPQWRLSPSYTVENPTRKKKKNIQPSSANGFVQYRTQSLTGREAGLPRIFANEDDGLVSGFISQSSSSTRWIFYLEKIRYIISILFYRLPRAVAEWELWIGACSAALYFVAMNQPFGFRKKNSQNETNPKPGNLFMDGVLHRVVESSESNMNSTSKVVKLVGEGSNVEVLEKSFDELINKGESR